jgi:hypothetical protein
LSKEGKPSLDHVKEYFHTLSRCLCVAKEVLLPLTVESSAVTSGIGAIFKRVLDRDVDGDKTPVLLSVFVDATMVDLRLTEQAVEVYAMWRASVLKPSGRVQRRCNFV